MRHCFETSRNWQRLFFRFNAKEQFEETAEVFGTPNREKEEISAAVEKIIAIQYKADPNICLNTTRLHMFTEKVTKSVIAVNPEKHSPTSAAAKFHSYRIYHQVQGWKGVDLNPLEWGWRKQDDVLLPIKTDLPPRAGLSVENYTL